NRLQYFYYYGATRRPYYSNKSWAIWNSQTGFGRVPISNITSTNYAEDGIPEVVLANAQVSSSYVSFVVSEDTSQVTGTFPSTSNCIEQAYVSAYSGSSIPFVVINGQYVHGGATLIQPNDVSSYT